MSNLTIIVSELSDSESLTDSCPMLPSLAMSEHSLVKGTPQAIKEWLMLSQVVSPVSHSAMQESDLEKMTTATCGLQHGIASASFDPDDACLRTFQVSLLADISQPSLETWPKAGIVCGGAFYPQPNWERRISEIGSGLLPTPTAQEPGWAVGGQVEIVDKDGNTPTHYNQRWYDKNTGRLVQKGVTQVAQMWPTPTAYDANDVKRSPEGWSKRAAYRQSIGRDHIGTAGLSERIWLADNNVPLKISQWPTPRAGRDTLCGGVGHRKMLQGTELETGRGQLNPDWVEWLMGWPIGWTSLEPLSADNFAQWFDDATRSAWWANEPDIPRVAKGIADRVGRLKALGNGQVPATVAAAWHILK